MSSDYNLKDRTKTKPSAQANQSIIDGMTVLQAIAMSQDPVGSRELARRLDMETTRVNRLLKTLAYLGIAQQTSNRKYIPGPGMHVLATQSLYASKLLRCAIGPLEKLAYFGHTVALGVLWRDSVSYLYHRRPGMPSAEAIGRIGLRNATSSGIGMVLLAAFSDEEVIETYQNKEIPGFENIDALLAELNVVREQGYARVMVDSNYSQNEGRETHTVAIPVGNPINSAIAISGWIPEQSVGDIVRGLQDVRVDIDECLMADNKAK